MKLLKKILITAMIISLVSSMALSVVNAADMMPGDTIGINDDDAEFDELVCVRNGITYIPLRLAFPNFNNRNSHVGLGLSYDSNTIHIIYGKTTGGDYLTAMENGEQVTKLPFESERKCVDLMWKGNAREGIMASYSYMTYSGLDNGIPKNIDEKSHGQNQIHILLKALNSGAGDRMYISIDDAIKISKWLGLDERYSVKLYKL